MNRLYRYVAPERIDVLQNRCLRFTQPHLFNDPFEMQPVFSGLQDDGENIEAIGAILEEVRLRVVPQFYQQVGVLVLAEKPDNLLMWAHYAKNHEGLVLEFDTNHPFFNARTGADDVYHHLQRVRYSNKRPSVAVANFLGATTLLTKSVEWAYEEEWRMVRPVSEATRTIPSPIGDVHLFEFPPEVLSGVVIGARVPEDRRLEIVELIRQEPTYGHVEVRQAELDLKVFQVNLREISDYYYHRGMHSTARCFRYQGSDAKQVTEHTAGALADLGRAIQLKPDVGAYYFARGAVNQLFAREWRQAVDDYDAAVRLDPTDAGWLVERGKLHADLRDFKAAAADFERAGWLGFEGAGNLLAQLRELEASVGPLPARDWALDAKIVAAEAAEDWDRVIELGESASREPQSDPECAARLATAYRWRGYQAHSKNRLRDAVTAYTRAIELTPQDADLHHRRGLARGAAKDMKKALADFNRAVELDARNADYLISRAKARYHAKQDLPEAIRDVTAAIALGSDQPEHFALRALIYDEAGLEDEAAQDRRMVAFTERMRRAGP